MTEVDIRDLFSVLWPLSEVKWKQQQHSRSLSKTTGRLRRQQGGHDRQEHRLLWSQRCRDDSLFRWFISGSTIPSLKVWPVPWFCHKKGYPLISICYIMILVLEKWLRNGDKKSNCENPKSGREGGGREKTSNDLDISETEKRRLVSKGKCGNK